MLCLACKGQSMQQIASYAAERQLQRGEALAETSEYFPPVL